MKFDEIKNRLTGISCPIFGFSWQPPESERGVARRLITFLEDRRVLYVPSAMEVPRHCVESVMRIREYLTAELGQLPTERELAKNLRAMRSACRKFLDTIQDERDEIILFGGRLNHWASWTFNGALGELRGVFGIHIAQIASQYGLDVEDDLASIIPAADAEEPESQARESHMKRPGMR